MKSITGLLVVAIFAAFISSAESKSLNCYQCGKGDACYFRLSNTTTKWNYGSSISCQEDESCFTLITHGMSYDIYERGCKKPEKPKNGTDCATNGKTTTCYCKSKDNCNDEKYKMVMTTTTTRTTTTTTKTTTTTTTTTTKTITTTAGKTSTANPTNTTATTSVSVPIIQCYSFNSGENFNKSGNLKSHLCPLGENACFKNAVTDENGNYQNITRGCTSKNPQIPDGKCEYDSIEKTIICHCHTDKCNDERLVIKKPAEPTSNGGFHGWSFFGGILLTLGLFAIGFIGFRRYKTKKLGNSFSYGRQLSNASHVSNDNGNAFA